MAVAHRHSTCGAVFSVLVERWGLRASALAGAVLLLSNAATNELFFWLPPPADAAAVAAGAHGGRFGWLAVLSEVLNGMSAPVQNITVGRARG